MARDIPIALVHCDTHHGDQMGIKKVVAASINDERTDARIDQTAFSWRPAETGLAPVYEAQPAKPSKTFECKLVGEVPMGTHIMMLGEVQRIVVHKALGKTAHIDWLPFADVEPAE